MIVARIGTSLYSGIAPLNVDSVTLPTAPYHIHECLRLFVAPFFAALLSCSPPPAPPNVMVGTANVFMSEGLYILKIYPGGLDRVSRDLIVQLSSSFSGQH